MRASVRMMMVLVALFFVLGTVGCGKKAQIGEECKRHSQCESNVCGADMKCQSKEEQRKDRKESAKKRGG